MSPRPRTASDEEILAATARVVARVGPRFTLADVAKEIGLAPATLIQRFQSKRGLMLALASSAGGGAEEQMRAIHDLAKTSPLAALYAYGECMTHMAPTPEELANHLAFLQIDMTDPEFRELAQQHSRASLREIKKLMDDAVRLGELAPTDTHRLALAMSAMMGGSLLAWAMMGEGTAQKAMRRDLETLLAPLQRRAPKHPPRRQLRKAKASLR